MEGLVGESITPWGLGSVQAVVRGADGLHTIIYNPDRAPVCSCRVSRCVHSHFVVSLLGSKDPGGADANAAEIIKDAYRMRRFVMEQLIPRAKQGVNILGYSLKDWWRIYLGHN